MAGYLFVHFIGEQADGEQIYFSVSRDGLHWSDLNHGRPILRSDIGELGVRDPFMVRDENNGIFYLMATDLRLQAGKGWDSAQYKGSRDLIVWRSWDLVHWSGPNSCRVGVDGAGCVWAPESIYDRERQAFFVFWASMVKLAGDAGPKQRIYGAYTSDFQKFTKPVIYMETQNHVIDMNIVEENGWYYRFIKDETTKTVRLDKVRGIHDKNAVPIPAGTLENLFGVEGPEAFRLPDGRWCLLVDQFGSGKGYLPLLSNDLGAGDFEAAPPESYDLGDTKKRHGGVILLSDNELERVCQAFPSN